ncbi:hypothetical protein Anas_09332 [Armadillidium nasatum]|uniref:Transmembrane protein n=1 Tax=Armadillidium nasatum TaxID=96803 RepID=A0A5N5SP78_9CRUS|nr:hypothetical protein Anas_09332 [Armadillidium nasatum]
MAKILDNLNNKLVNVGLKPIHPCTIMFYYIPLKGSISYTVLGTQMLTPELYENVKLIIVPKYISLTNACLLNSFVGTSLYLFSRPHLLKTPPKERLAFCVFGSSMFNLGSMLLWALGRTVAPDSTPLRFVIGLSGAAGLLWLATKYVSVIDSQISSKPHK